MSELYSASQMKFTRLGLLVLAMATALGQQAPEVDSLQIASETNGDSEVEFDLDTGVASASGGVIVTYRGSLLRAHAWNHLVRRTTETLTFCWSTKNAKGCAQNSAMWTSVP